MKNVLEFVKNNKIKLVVIFLVLVLILSIYVTYIFFSKEKRRKEVEKMSTNEEKISWVAKLIIGFGVPSNWAKVIAGAIIGGLAAAGILTQSGCSLSVDVLPDSSQHWEGSLSPLPQLVTPLDK